MFNHRDIENRNKGEIRYCPELLELLVSLSTKFEK